MRLISLASFILPALCALTVETYICSSNGMPCETVAIPWRPVWSIASTRLLERFEDDCIPSAVAHILRSRYGFKVPNWAADDQCNDKLISLAETAADTVSEALKNIAKIQIEAILFHRGVLSGFEAADYAFNAGVFALAPSSEDERSIFEVCYGLTEGDVQILHARRSTSV